MKTKTLRIIQDYFQPKIGRKIRIFSLGRIGITTFSYERKECTEIDISHCCVQDGKEIICKDL